MMITTLELNFSTKKDSVIDITPDVKEAVKKNGIQNGIVLIFVPGSTGAVTTIEYEPGLQKDLFDTLERIAPKEGEYAHNLRWGDGNGYSHVRASIIGPSLVVPIVNGSLVLGTWQQIVFLELDNRNRDRRIILQIIGA
ncbi:MAG: secondary thiamine-phosphate synthase enzyme YjbQ [Candidatus Korarchaeota archaeon]